MPPEPAPGLLADRYGGSRRGLLRPVAVAAVLGIAFAGWLVWTVAFHATPDATSELVGYEIVGENAATGTLDVRLGDGVDPASVTCVLRATAYDHTTVGELRFAPRPGRSTYEVRTERRATTVERIGCTTAEQPRPR